MGKIKPPIIKVYSRIRLNSMLRDARYCSYMHVFGKVEDVANQYGIKITPRDGYIEFSAPKLRMQLFVEKLHFAGIPFSEDPF